MRKDRLDNLVIKRSRKTKRKTESKTHRWPKRWNRNQRQHRRRRRRRTRRRRIWGGRSNKTFQNQKILSNLRLQMIYMDSTNKLWATMYNTIMNYKHIAARVLCSICKVTLCYTKIVINYDSGLQQWKPRKYRHRSSYEQHYRAYCSKFTITALLQD